MSLFFIIHFIEIISTVMIYALVAYFFLFRKNFEMTLLSSFLAGAVLIIPNILILFAFLFRLYLT